MTFQAQPLNAITDQLLYEIYLLILGGGGGGGSVTSVGLSAPSADITVTGSPVTTSGTIALSWTDYILHRSGGTKSVDFGNSFLYEETGAMVTVDYTTSRRLLGAGSVVSVNWANRQLIDSSGVQSIHWNSRIAKDSSNVTVIDWQNKSLVDTSSVASIDWQNRFLKDPTGNNSIGYGSYLLIDSATNESIDWNSRFLKDGTELVSIEYGNRALIESGGDTSLNWDTRELRHSGTNVLTWSNTTVTIDSSVILDYGLTGSPAQSPVATPASFYIGQNNFVLTEPDKWFKFSFSKTEYVIPGYAV